MSGKRRRLPLVMVLLGAGLLVSGIGGLTDANDGSPGMSALADSTTGKRESKTLVETENLPTIPGIRDPVFSVLLALVHEDYTGTVSGKQLDREVKRAGRSTRMPVSYMREIRRTLIEGKPQARVALVSKTGLDLPIPYKILAYRPGRVRVSAVVELDEWKLGTIRIDGAKKNDPAVVLEDVYLWGLRRGTVELDVDGWLDRMLGPKLDDTRVTGFALFRYQEKWVGLAVGYNRWGKGRSGSFNFEQDKIFFPNPRPLKAAGVFLRGRLERLMPRPFGFRPSRLPKG